MFYYFALAVVKVPMRYHKGANRSPGHVLFLAELSGSIRNEYFMLIPTLLICVYFNTAFSVSLMRMSMADFTSMLIHFSKNRGFK